MKKNRKGILFSKNHNIVSKDLLDIVQVLDDDLNYFKF